jgi:hypothetical protein
MVADRILTKLTKINSACASAGRPEIGKASVKLFASFSQLLGTGLSSREAQLRRLGDLHCYLGEQPTMSEIAHPYSVLVD